MPTFGQEPKGSQQTQGEKATQTPQAGPGKLEGGRGVSAAFGPAFDFSRIPIHAPRPDGAFSEAGAGPRDAPGARLPRARVHADEQSAASAEALGAEAYARGSDIFFGAGRYRPTLPSGRRLLLHEMAHVVQQQNPAPGHASGDALEREADRAAADWSAGREASIALSAPHGQAQCQQVKWKTGDVIVNREAADQIKNKGGLFSGNDQAHVNVSSTGKLAYDEDYTTPEDPFRWARLKDIIDTAHLKIWAVSASQKFKVKETPKATPVDTSITEIGLLVNNLSVMGITLKAGEKSPDSTYDQIYYDKDQGMGALTHELFGHEWLATKGVPSGHPPAGSPEEKSKGTLNPSHNITDPFGNIFSGTVREYIARYVESLGTNTKVTTGAGKQISVPKSPTQQVGQDQLIKAFADVHKEATSGGVTKNNYSPAAAQAWRIMCNNYDVMQTSAEALRAGNSNLGFTKEVLLALSLMVFNSWSADAQSGFRILLADFSNSRSGFRPNELSSKLEAAVNAAPSAPAPQPNQPPQAPPQAPPP
ncbi:MAG TPA: DUF4157 domain-containing protein [Pyrinomonadaceae bacterium]